MPAPTLLTNRSDISLLGDTPASPRSFRNILCNKGVNPHFCRRLFFLRALGPITVTILSIAIMNIFKLYQPGKGGPNGISSIGHIPRGLPGYTGDKFFPFVGSVGETLGLSIVVCLVDLTESISIARALAQKNRYFLTRLDPLHALRWLCAHVMAHPIPNLVLAPKLVQHTVKPRDSDSNMLGTI